MRVYVSGQIQPEKMEGDARNFKDSGRGRLCSYRYTVTTRMIPALRWAAMRAILMFQ